LFCSKKVFFTQDLTLLNPVWGSALEMKKNVLPQCFSIYSGSQKYVPFSNTTSWWGMTLPNRPLMIRISNGNIFLRTAIIEYEASGNCGTLTVSLSVISCWKDDFYVNRCCLFVNKKKEMGDSYEYGPFPESVFPRPLFPFLTFASPYYTFHMPMPETLFLTRTVSRNADASDSTPNHSAEIMG